jgi:hypothetical protein
VLNYEKKHENKSDKEVLRQDAWQTDCLAFQAEEDVPCDVRAVLQEAQQAEADLDGSQEAVEDRQKTGEAVS